MPGNSAEQERDTAPRLTKITRLVNSAMKRRLISQVLLLSAVCSMFFLTGCATIDSRISEHPDMFQRLSPSDQALVREGKIRDGMSQDGVYLAWGGPNERVPGRVHGKPADTWVYTATSHYPYPYGWGPSFYGGIHGYGFYGLGSGFYRYGYGGFYEPFFYDYRPSFDYPERLVSFQNGRVVGYQMLYPPRVWN